MLNSKSRVLRIFLFFYLILSGCSKPPVKVGIFHNLSGTMAISGKSMVDATMFAIDEINKTGGVLNGRKILPVVFDANPDKMSYEDGARSLIEHDQVQVIFGCWTSSCRKEVKKVVEKYNIFLFYPVQYEGLESSRNIIYTGSLPNQQIIPSIKWIIENKGKRIYLVGSDYIFPRLANRIIRDMVLFHKGKIISERYLPLGSSQTRDIVNEIAQMHPNAVLNTINGDSNRYFFQDLSKAGIRSDQIPVVSYSIAEDELTQMDIKNLEGHYAVWNYFQSLDNSENKKLVEDFKKKFGKDRVLDNPMLSAYISVKIWANALSELQIYNMDRLREAIRQQSMNTPAGIVSIEYSNLHMWQPVYIGKINSIGQFDIVWESKYPVRPFNYPKYRNLEDWEFIVRQWE